MGKVVSFCNPKGGTAKTSTVVNLACALTTVHKRVLLVDFDPQRSASVALGYNNTDVENNLGTAILDNVDIKRCITSYPKGGFDIVLSSDDLTAIPAVLHDNPVSHLALKKVLDTVKDRYDYILVDTPASLSMISICAICASDYLIVPVCLDMFSIDSMNTLLSKYYSLKEQGKTSCVFAGLLRTLFDINQPLCRTINKELETAFTDLLFKTKITFSHKISESSSAACPVLLYDRTCLGAQQYLSFTAEFLKRTR